VKQNYSTTKPTYLAYSNRSPFVTQREATELRVINEALDTNGEGRFYECYDFLACGRGIQRKTV
jgi:hypothetical protein